MNVFLRKCKSLSKLGKSTSYNSLRSTKSTVQDWSMEETRDQRDDLTVVFVGSSRRRYTISEKNLNHPVISALIDRSKSGGGDDDKLSIKCEVVLFDHLLWLLENADPEEVIKEGALEELAQLYVC